jgi:RHS repeat-associated protein
MSKLIYRFIFLCLLCLFAWQVQAINKGGFRTIGFIAPSTQTIYVDASPTVLSLTGPDITGHTIQWYSSSNGTDFYPISGATSTTYTPTGTAAVFYYEAYLTATSAPTSGYTPIAVVNRVAHLSAGTVSPATATVAYNTSPGVLSGTGGVAGIGSYSYQWQNSLDNSTFTNISGATNVNYSAPALTAVTYFRLKITAGAETVYTATIPVSLSVQPGTISPATGSIVYGASPGLLTASTPLYGNGNYYYQWQKSVDSSTWTNLSGATLLNFNPDNIVVNTWYRLMVTSNLVTAYSSPAKFYVYNEVMPGALIADTLKDNLYGATGLNKFPASGGNGVFAYQWQQSANGSTWTDLPGATDWQYAPYGLTATTYFRLKVVSAGITRYTSAVACLLPLNGGLIGINNSVISSGGTVTLSPVQNASGGGCGAYAYIVQQSTDGYTWVTIGTTSPSGIVKSTWYRRVAFCGINSASSNVVRVKIAGGTLAPDTATRAVAGTETLVAMPSYPVGIDATNLNYIKSRTFTKPGITDQATADAVTAVQDVAQKTVFFDGLGRTRQTVTKQATPDGADWIVPTFYDVYGREAKNYLGYTDGVSSGSFRTNPGAAQPVFYNTQYQDKESYYYSNISYEASPLNRVLETSAPGKSWVGRGIGIGQLERTNMVYDSVVMWNIDNVNGTLPVQMGYYVPGTLSVTETTDEHDNKKIQFKDMDGLLVMEKMQLADQLTIGYTGWLTTMYVYDDLGRKRFVITPKAVDAIRSNWVMTSTIATELCFQYRFDYRNQMVVKKYPGADSTEMVWNKRGLLVASRDGNLKAINFWHVHYYDSMDRERMNGLINFSYSRELMQALVYSKPMDPVNALPFTSESFVKDLVNLYYDDYSYTGNRAYVTTDIGKLSAGANYYPLTVPAVASKLTRGMNTGTRTRVDYEDAGPFLIKNSFYDDKGHLIQSIENNISGGLSIIYHQYSFSGNLLSDYLKQTNPASTLTPQTTVLYLFHYDARGRRDSVKQRINDNLLYQQTIAVNEYNELSELSTKRVNATASSELATWRNMQNIRHWPTGVNPDYVLGGSSDWYGEVVSYDYGFGRKAWNGNVAGVKWKGASDGTARALAADYDNVDRLTSATFAQQNNGSTNWTQDQINFTTSGIGYDQNGNVLAMKQTGMDGITIKTVDSLKMGTVLNSNRLLFVTDKRNDAASKLGDFKETINDESQDYLYDHSGNVSFDNNKGVQLCLYNHLNQLNTIIVTGKGSVYYQYTGLGEKVRKMVVDTTGGTTKTTIIDYIGGLQYDSSLLTQINTEEGRVIPVYKNSLLTGFTFNYFGKNHTGDIAIELTTKSDTTKYVLTNELAARAVENALFTKVDSTATAKPIGYPVDATTNPNDYVTMLNASTGKKIGPGLVLRVMTGDKVQAGVKALYKNSGANTSSTTSSAMVDAILQAFASGGTADGVHNSSGADGTINSLNSSLYDGLKTKDPLQNLATKPKAYLNYVLFDDQFNMVNENSGVLQVNGAIDSLVALVLNEMTAKRSGFWYFYLSNESNQNVYFDNLIVTHTSGSLVEQNSYYPFGGIMAGISSKAIKGAGYPANKLKFNGKEFQTGEFDNGAWGTDWSDFGARLYDALSMHFLSVDPLAGSHENASLFGFAKGNPFRFTDPDGRAPFDVILYGAEAQAAFKQLQASMKGIMKVHMDQYGKLSYSDVNKKKPDKKSKQLMEAIDDHAVQVNVTAENVKVIGDRILAGGGLLGNEPSPAAGAPMQAFQAANPQFMEKMDEFNEKPNSGVLHEVVEGWIASVIARAIGITYGCGQPMPEGYYMAAHSTAPPQSGEIREYYFDANGKRVYNFNEAFKVLYMLEKPDGSVLKIQENP